jgi:hypothetical protein
MRYQAPPNATNISFEQDVYAVKDGVVDCPQSVAAYLGLTPVADAAPSKKSSGTGDKDKDKDAIESPILDVNANDAKALVAKTDDVTALEAFEVAEGQNPRGARKSVLEAILAKLAELRK